MSFLRPNDTHQFNVVETIYTLRLGFLPDSTGIISLPLPSAAIVAQLPAEEIGIIEGYFKAIKDETSVSDRHSLLGAYAALSLLIIYLLRHGQPTSADSTYSKLQQALLYINQHCLEDYLDLNQVARACNLSPCYFSHIFKKLHGSSFSSYLNECRLRCACFLLRETDDSITDIAYKSGFTSCSHFFRVFRSFFHCTPNDYRQNRGAASAIASGEQIPPSLWAQSDHVPTVSIDA